MRSNQWYLDTFRIYGFHVLMTKFHDRSKDGYNNEMIYCLKPIYLSEFDDAICPDALVEIGRKTKRFCN